MIQAYFHAAALTGRTLRSRAALGRESAIAPEPAEILREHPHAAPFWHGLLHGRSARRRPHRRQYDHHGAAGDGPVLPGEIRRRCVPGPVGLRPISPT